MNAVIRHTVLILLSWLMVAGVCYGKQVYLKDGGIIEAQSAWRKGGKVYVKVNRDIVADFTPDEIDLRRTFPKAKTPRRHIQHAAAVKAEPAKAVAVPAQASPAPAAAKPEQKAAVQPKPSSARPAPKAAVPAAPTAAAPAQKPATPPAPAPATAAKAPQQQAAQPVKPALPLTFMLLMLAVCVLIIAAQWIIFQKAGQAGWKCLVPFYNAYILMQIAGKPGWWMFLLFIPLVGVAIMLFAMLSLAKKFGRSELFGVGLLLLPMIFFPLLAFGGSDYEG